MLFMRCFYTFFSQTSEEAKAFSKDLFVNVSISFSKKD